MLTIAPPNTPRSQAGLGLVELMIAMTLGLFLLAGIITVFITNKQTYINQQGIAHIQESGRFASARLAHDIRLAGYRGCRSAADRVSNQLDESSSFFNDFTGRNKAGDNNRFRALRGYYRDSSGTMDLPAKLDIQPVDNSDILVLRIPLGEIYVVANANNDKGALPAKADNPITVDQPTRGLSAGDAAIIYSCRAGATIFRVTGVTDGTTIHTADGTDLPAYGKNRGMLQRLATVTYFVARSADSRQQPTLYRKIDDGSPAELVSGVDGMRILYHVDGAYQPAPDVDDGDWSDVDNVLIALLINSVQPVAKAAEKPTFGLFEELTDQTITLSPAREDRRIRRVFEISAHPRN